MSNRSQKLQDSLKRSFSTPEGLKVSLTLIGLIVSLFPMIFGNSQLMAVVLVVAAFVWGWRQALYILGVASIASLFTRNFIVGVMLLIFVVPVIAFFVGLFRMTVGIIGYIFREIGYILG